MRKFDRKNTISFNAFGVLIIAVIVGLASVVYTMVSNKDAAFTVPESSIIYDTSGTYKAVPAGGSITKGHGEHYILNTEGKKTDLGEFALVYNNLNSSLSFFGKGYQLFSDGTVEGIKDGERISASSTTRLYKIADGVYLMTGDRIRSTDNAVNLRDFVMIQLGRNGGAQLINHEMNKHVVRNMLLTSNDVYFELNNELLYADGNLINLKDIIGSSNQYTGASLLAAENIIRDLDVRQYQNILTVRGGDGGTGGTGGNGGTGGRGGTGGTGGKGGNGGNGGHGGYGGNGGDGGTGGTGGYGGTGGGGGEGRNQYEDSIFVKDFKLTGANTSTNAINLGYNINDTANQYAACYIVIDGIPGQFYLDKTSNSFLVQGLEPDTAYNVKAYYQTYSTKGLSEPILQDSLVIRTDPISVSIRVDKVTSSSLVYTVTVSEGMTIESPWLEITADGVADPLFSGAITVGSAPGSYSGAADFGQRLLGVNYQITLALRNGGKVAATDQFNVQLRENIVEPNG